MPTSPEASAFPHEDKSYYCHGLTKREYFAIKCLQGILANPDLTSGNQEKIIEGAVEMADLLIAELNKE